VTVCTSHRVCRAAAVSTQCPCSAADWRGQCKCECECTQTRPAGGVLGARGQVCLCVFMCADKTGQLRRAHLWAASTGLPGLRCASIPFADDVMFSFGPGVAALWFRALGALWVVAAADMGGVSLQHWIITRALEQAPWTEPDRCRAGEGVR
jgi:hypothetical protein